MVESEGEDSGVISPVEPAVAGVSGVVVGGAAVAEEENCDSNSNAEKNNPWPHIQPYFRFSKSSDKKIIYLCELCPGNKPVSAHKSSLTNLKAHMSSKHKDKHDEFLQLVTRKSKRGLHTKRRMNSESEASVSSRSASVDESMSGKSKRRALAQQSQSHITEWVGSVAMEAGTKKARQKKMDWMLVDIFIENMFSLQVRLMNFHTI